METNVAIRPSLQFQLAREAADFDMELDCWTALCFDGWTVYGATADEAEGKRAEHERIARKHAACNPELAW
jgi:hypothetical protein